MAGPPSQLSHTSTGEGDEYELRGPDDARLYDARVDLQVVAWRELCFLRAGLPRLLSRALAMRRDIDRVDVERLLSNGATPRQVRRLLL